MLALLAVASVVGIRGVGLVPAPEGLPGLAVPAAPAAAPPDSWAPVEAGLRHLSRNPRGRDAKTLRRIYEERGFRPFWVTPDSLSDAGQSLVGHLAGPSRERLWSEERRLTEIGHLLDRAYPRPFEVRVHAIPELEWAFSKAFLLRTSRLLEGRRPSAHARGSWNRAADLEGGRYRLRRKPGPANDLGRIKFMFPNEHSVYLHDTPSRHLFERETRAFSHGCIRVGRPLELARHLIPAGFREGELESEAGGTTERVVRLDRPVPIYIVYFTAWRSDDGMVHFRDDIYGHDEKLWAELREDRAVEPAEPSLGLFSSDFE